MLEESHDSKGDHQLFFYKQENSIAVSQEDYELNRTVGAQRYLQRIQYGNHTAVLDSILLTNHPALTDQNQWHFEVVFDYGEYNINADNSDPYTPAQDWSCRDDPFSSYTAGFEIRTCRLCSSALLFHRFDELGASPVLIHATTYNYSLNNAYISVITSVTDTGYQFDMANQTYETAAYPDLTFSYTPFNPAGHEFVPLTNSRQQNLAGITEPPKGVGKNKLSHAVQLLQ